MEEILFIDTETGGFDPDKHSLLSIGLVAWSPDGGIIGEKEIYIKHLEYNVTKEAAQINGFCIEKQDEIGVYPKVAISEIDGFISRYFSEQGKIVLGGHNTHFDIGFLRKLYMSNSLSFEKRFSHRTMDTSVIIRFLRLSGIVNFAGGLSTAIKKYDISSTNRHGALNDAVATAKLFDLLLHQVHDLQKS